jgi:hypothetical protein
VVVVVAATVVVLATAVVDAALLDDEAIVVVVVVVLAVDVGDVDVGALLHDATATIDSSETATNLRVCSVVIMVPSFRVAECYTRKIGATSTCDLRSVQRRRPRARNDATKARSLASLVLRIPQRHSASILRASRC